MLMKFNKRARKIINVRRLGMNKEYKDIIDKVKSEFSIKNIIILNLLLKISIEYF